MKMKKLADYLKAYRKRSGLSQEDMAFLFGAETDAIVWQYEHGVRAPGLTNLITYEYIFQVSSRELFAGIYEKVGRDTDMRVKKLLTRINRKPFTSRSSRKIVFLNAILSRTTNTFPHL